MFQRAEATDHRDKKRGRPVEQYHRFGRLNRAHQAPVARQDDIAIAKRDKGYRGKIKRGLKIRKGVQAKMIDNPIEPDLNGMYGKQAKYDKQYGQNPQRRCI